MLLRFKDNSEISYENIVARSMYYQGTSRDCLDIDCRKDLYSMDDLFDIFCDEEKTSQMRILDGEEVINVLSDYVILAKMTLEAVEIVPGDSDNLPVTENRVRISLCKLSYLEKQLKSLGVSLSDA